MLAFCCKIVQAVYCPWSQDHILEKQKGNYYEREKNHGMKCNTRLKYMLQYLKTSKRLPWPISKQAWFCSHFLAPKPLLSFFLSNYQSLIKEKKVIVQSIKQITIQVKIICTLIKENKKYRKSTVLEKINSCTCKKLLYVQPLILEGELIITKK